MSILALAQYLHSKYSGSSRVNTDGRRRRTLFVNRHTGEKKTYVPLLRPEKWEEASTDTKGRYVREAKRMIRIAGKE